MPYTKINGKNVYVNPNKKSSSKSSSKSSNNQAVINAILTNPGISEEEKEKWADTSKTYEQKVSEAYKSAGISQDPVEQLKDVTVVEIPSTPKNETVTVEGLGYSVAPELQKEFVENLPVKSKSSIEEPKVTTQELSANQLSAIAVASKITNQENIEREREGIFFVDSKIDTRKQETAIIPPPTIEQINRRNQLNQNILTADTKYIKEQNVKVENVTNKIIKLSNENEKIVKNIDDIDKQLSRFDKYIEGEYFTGTEAQYKEYKMYYNARDAEYNKYLKLKSNYDIENEKLKALGGRIDEEGYIKEPTIKVGVGKWTKEEPISKYKGLSSEYKAAGTSIDILGQTAFATIGTGVEKAFNVLGIKTVIKEGTMAKTGTGTIQWTGELGTKPSGSIYFKREALTSKDVGNVVYEVGSESVSFGKYAIPYLGAAIFGGEVIGNVKESGGLKSYIKEKPLEAGITGAVLLTGGLLGSASRVRNKAVEKAVSKELNKLSEVPIKSLTIIDEGAGKVSAYGIRESGGLKQEVRYYGDIKQTEKGFKFIPSGKGTSVTQGIVKPNEVLGMNLKPRAVGLRQEFELGTKGKDVFIGKIGDAKVYEEFGLTTIIPKDTYFGIEKVKKGVTEVNLLKQKPENIIYKDITIPTKEDRNLFFELTDDVGLKMSNRELGTVIKLKPVQEESGVTFIMGKKKQQFDILYHGTTEKSLPSIFKEGLKPGKDIGIGDKSLVSLGKSPEEVSGFATRSALKNRWKGIDDKPVILEVKVPKGEYEVGIGKSGVEEYRILTAPKENLRLLELTKKEETIKLPSLDIKLPKVKLKVKEEVNLPRMLGGKGVSSIYEGTGRYERAESSGAFNLGSMAVFKEQMQIQKEEPIINLSKGKSILKPVIEDKSKIDLVVKDLEINKILPKEQEKVIQRPVEIVQSKTQQVQRQQLIQRLTQSFRPRPIIKSSFKPSVKAKLLPLIKLPQDKSKFTIKKEESGFEAIGFRFGKEVKLGGGTKGQASKELSEFLSGTLGASGYLKKGNIKLKAEETGLLSEFGFRKSKTGSKFLVVEEKPLRLRKGTTGKDIQFFKR